MKKVTIKLVQGEKTLIFSKEFEAQAITQVSGTIALNIIALFKRARKHRLNLDGFSFSRKFDVVLIIDEKEASGTNVIALDTVRFGITLQDSVESVTRFGSFIDELTNDILTKAADTVINLSNLVEELGYANN